MQPRSCRCRHLACDTLVRRREAALKTCIVDFLRRFLLSHGVQFTFIRIARTLILCSIAIHYEISCALLVFFLSGFTWASMKQIYMLRFMQGLGLQLVVLKRVAGVVKNSVKRV